MNYQRIGALITDLRNKKNMSQTHLARKLNVSPKTVSKWENGHGLPHIDTLHKLCEILDVDINEMLSNEEFIAEQHVDQQEVSLQALADSTQSKDTLRKRKTIYWILTSIQSLFGVLALIFMILMMEGEGPLISAELAIAFTIPLVAFYLGQLVTVSIMFCKTSSKHKADYLFLAISILLLPFFTALYSFWIFCI